MPRAHFKRWRGRIGLLFFMILPLGGARVGLSAGSENAIHVGGGAAQPGDWTLARLEKDFASEIKTVEYTSKGQKRRSRCVSLLAVLNRAGVQTKLNMDPKSDPKDKNFPLRLVVIVTGRDGYAVVFSLPEMLEDIGHKDAWLALDTDGKPLPESDGPVRLIVPGDDKPARWVRSVADVSIIDGTRRK
jgi:hypothetical protein